ncbi:stAR-related lipid transfer protein 7, mitochondrial [Drosophila nasuta]|uniref:StAR-related lipid transfer protein 7, mitochondrial n=1 Tax=Drosophila albomicans TaxID=7291 RepID=A0A6P8XP06_DROAB|nr:stAR-related lipid transfer protein 7, mitochondrial [Drosophila albomicans]XP_060665839.1 stAR-related lipid transfer protein 7, mitochondrial [Drosophila nasuta]
MLLNRLVLAIKNQSRETLRAWSYQCESIIAQRSRRVQQLFSFYQSVYGTQGLKQLWRAYYRNELQPPIRGMMLSAVGLMGLNMKRLSNSDGFDWSKERLSLANFDLCQRDIDFINTLSVNQLCERCQSKKMKYCYCQLGNQRCRKGGIVVPPPSSDQKPMKEEQAASISNCHKALELDTRSAPAGQVRIQAQEDRNWEPYFSKNEFSIWRREERSSLYSYKVYARFDDITADDFLHVQTDLDYRRQWDDTALRLELISEDPVPGSNSHLIYWEMQWPRLFANRDYVYCRRYHKDDSKKMIFICSRAAKHNTYPSISGKVRVTDYWSLMVIKPFRGFHEPGLHFVLTYYDDPGIPIPQNIKSWVTQKQMPEFLTKMYVATKNYACSRAIKMKDMYNSFTLINDEYTANDQRGSWLGSLSRHRRKLNENEKER